MISMKDVVKKSFLTWLIGLLALTPTMFIAWLATFVPGLAMVIVFGVLAGFVGLGLKALDDLPE